MKTRTEAIKATEKELLTDLNKLEGVNYAEYYHANEQIKVSVKHGFVERIMDFIDNKCIGIFKFSIEIDNHTGCIFIYADYDVNALPCPSEFIL